jgi:Acetyltransferase (GNAT) domain
MVLPAGGAQTLFQEDWWLQAAAGGAMERVEVNWGGSVVASLSFLRKTRFPNICYLVMPPYTRTLGPVLNLPASGPTRRAMNVRRVTAELLAQLPRHDCFYSLLDPADESAFGFSLAGCSVVLQHTFRVPAGAEAGRLLQNVDTATRRLIRAASRRLKIHRHLDLDRFIALARRDFPADESFHDFPALRRLFDGCIARGQTAILTATDETGADVASVVLVWGHGTLYYWIPHRDRQRSGGDANAFLLWTALEFALDRGLAFDADSFASVGTGRFLSSFGLPHEVRPLVFHRTLRGTILEAIRGKLRNATVKDLQPDPLAVASATNARWSGRLRSMLTRRTDSGRATRD